jgi:hypothetical protein
MAEPDLSRVKHTVDRILANREAVQHHGTVIAATFGALLLTLGVIIGQKPWHLIMDGTRTTGRVVAYETRSGSNKTGYASIVEFEAGDRTVQFTNHMGRYRMPVKGEVVTIFYDADDPEQAMIDYGKLNWFPWSGIFGMGLLLVLAAIDRWLRSKSIPRTSVFERK